MRTRLRIRRVPLSAVLCCAVLCAASSASSAAPVGAVAPDPRRARCAAEREGAEAPRQARHGPVAGTPTYRTRNAARSTRHAAHVARETIRKRHRGKFCSLQPLVGMRAVNARRGTVARTHACGCSHYNACRCAMRPRGSRRTSRRTRRLTRCGARLIAMRPAAQSRRTAHRRSIRRQPRGVWFATVRAVCRIASQRVLAIGRTPRSARRD